MMQRPIAYVVAAMFSLAYMGNVAEYCSVRSTADALETCPARPASVIAMGVFTFLITAPLAALSTKSILPSLVELAITIFALICNSAALAVTSSEKTPVSFTAVFFSTITQLALVHAIGLTLGDAQDDYPSSTANKGVYGSSVATSATGVTMQQPHAPAPMPSMQPPPMQQQQPMQPPPANAV